MASSDQTMPVDATGARSAADRGSTTLTTLLLTPVFVAIAFMAFQAALWSHARTEARAMARNSANLVARSQADPGDTEQSAALMLAEGSDLADATVSIVVANDLVTARVTGRAPGLLRGTSKQVDVVAVVPVERFRP